MASSGDEDKINIEALGVRVECSTCNVRLGPQAMTMHLQVNNNKLKKRGINIIIEGRKKFPYLNK